MPRSVHAATLPLGWPESIDNARLFEVNVIRIAIFPRRRFYEHEPVNNRTDEAALARCHTILSRKRSLQEYLLL